MIRAYLLVPKHKAKNNWVEEARERRWPWCPVRVRGVSTSLPSLSSLTNTRTVQPDDVGATNPNNHNNHSWMSFRIQPEFWTSCCSCTQSALRILAHCGETLKNYFLKKRKSNKSAVTCKAFLLWYITSKYTEVWEGKSDTERLREKPGKEARFTSRHTSLPLREITLLSLQVRLNSCTSFLSLVTRPITEQRASW